MAISNSHQREQNLFSLSWYRIGELRPRLRPHIQIHRQVFRGIEWFVLQDHATGRFHRISAEAYFLIGLMDGRRTMNEIWEAAGMQLGESLLTQDEILALLSQLHQFDAIQSDISPDMYDMQLRSVREKRSRLIGYLASPLSLKIPLFDPDSFLNRTVPLVRPLFSWGGGLIWFLVISYGLSLVCIHWGELVSNVSDRVLSLENILLLSLIYPLVKFVHELGHAYAVKLWGGEVHEMGVMFMVFMPVPYLDATASYSFRSKYLKMLVGGAGIMVELLLAALAVIVWVNVPPGTVRTVAYNLMLIGGVSTVLMNGNPLIRYDAYYILSDFIEIPNLGMRSSQYLSYFVKRWILGISEVTGTARTAGEAAWLAGYGVASFCYRVFIMLSIALFVAGKFFVIGIILAAWSLGSFIMIPFYRLIKQGINDPLLRRYRVRTLLATAIAVFFVAGSVMGIRIPTFTVVEGVVQVPEEAQLHATAEGFIRAIVAVPESPVRRGDILMVSEAPRLDKEVQVSEANLREVEARYQLGRATDITATQVLHEERLKVGAELRRARERQTGLVVSSPSDGVFILPFAEDLSGRFVKKGAPLGYVVDYSRPVVRVVVGQEDVDMIRSRTDRVEARLASRLAAVIPAQIVREVPEASTDLPSLALSTSGGGEIALDPQEQHNNKKPQAFRKNFLFDIALTGVLLNRFGERAFIRFVHPPETMAERWYRNLRRLLIRRFDL